MSEPRAGESFLGEIGEHIQNLTITRITVRSLSPSTVLVEGRDPSDRLVKWVTRSRIDEKTETITFSVVSVKAHESYTGTDKTVIAAAKAAAVTMREVPPEDLYQDWTGQVFTYNQLRDHMEADAAGVDSDYFEFDFDEWLAEELFGGSVKRITDGSND